MATRFAHANLVAKDWKRPSTFYQKVFGCTPIPPERHLPGEWLDRATGLAGARVSGIHLRLPGFGDDGPTLDIFQYCSIPVRSQVDPILPGSRTSPLPSMMYRLQRGQSFNMGAPPVESSRRERCPA